jgi:hypothetical protein
MAHINKDVLRVIKGYIDEALAETEASAEAKTGEIYKGKGDDLPTSADFVGQLFIKTGSTNPGLYISTGTTTPGWKTVTHAS